MYPLTLCRRGNLVIAPEGWFDGIGGIDFAAGTLRINVGRPGPRGLRWLIDASGRFHGLRWLGYEPATILQRLSLALRVERYAIDAPRSISIGELADLASGLTDESEDLPYSGLLRDILAGKPRSDLVTRSVMWEFLGE